MSDTMKHAENLKEPHITGVKLTTGEEIICLLSHDPDNARYLMQNPALVGLQPNEDNTRLRIIFQPYLPAAHMGQISIVPNQLVAIYAPRKDISEEYRDKFRHTALQEAMEESTPKFEG